eukprot:gene12127-13379_t
MGSIVSVKERARKKTIAIDAFGTKIDDRYAQESVKVGRNEIHRVIVNINHVRENGKNETVAKEFVHSCKASKRKTKFETGNIIKRDVKAKQQATGAQFNGGETRERVVRDPETPGVKNKKLDQIHRFKADKDDTSRRSPINHRKHFVANTTESSFIHSEAEKNKSNSKQQQQQFKISQKAALLHEERHRKVPPTKHVQEWFTAVSLSGPIPNKSSCPSHALHTCEDGDIPTTTRQEEFQERVTSRDIDARVDSSASFYADFAHVTNLQVPQTADVADAANAKKHRPRSRCSGIANDCVCRDCKAEARKAAVIIQRVIRGHQARKEVLQRRDSVVKIQRLFRERIKTHGGLKVIEESDNQRETPPRKISKSMKPWRETSIVTPVQKEAEISEEAKESFDMYQDEITDLKWSSQQLIEQATMGNDYEPQKILLIASNVRKPEFLARVSLEDVHVIVYQFAAISLREIIENISLALDSYRVGSKAKRIAFVCQGGPGYVYLCRGKVLTQAKLAKDPQLRWFIKQLGAFMSKIEPVDAKIHVIGNNVLGNKKGCKLFEAVTEILKPNQCSIESPFEISANGVHMLQDYFDLEKYKLWKRIRNTKLWL